MHLLQNSEPFFNEIMLHNNFLFKQYFLCILSISKQFSRKSTIIIKDCYSFIYLKNLIHHTATMWSPNQIPFVSFSLLFYRSTQPKMLPIVILNLYMLRFSSLAPMPFPFCIFFSYIGVMFSHFVIFYLSRCQIIMPL